MGNVARPRRLGAGKQHTENTYAVRIWLRRCTEVHAIGSCNNHFFRLSGGAAYRDDPGWHGPGFEPGPTLRQRLADEYLVV